MEEVALYSSYQREEEVVVYSSYLGWISVQKFPERE
jgi:hypothetical protein